MPLVREKPDVDHLQQEALTLAINPTKSFHAFALALSAAHGRNPSFLYEVERVSGLKRRALFYLSAVGRLIDYYSITREQAERIGWTKLQIVARHVGEKDGVSRNQVIRYLKLAERTTAADLPDVLGPEPAPDGPMKSVLLRLTADQYAILEEALLKHGAEESGNGLKNKELAVTEMAQLCNGSIDAA